MQVIIPMSGYGERFRKAGYTVPKPLIVVEGKPIISHVIDLFSSTDSFIFICNSNHLNSTNMKEILLQYCPSGLIISIEPHKRGPVYAVSKAFPFIDDDKPTIINYCDFTCYWNYNDFKSYVLSNNLDGCIPGYKGFHPHSLGDTNYAYMREEGKRMLEIKEKEPFTDNRLNEYASSGTYYFSKGFYVKHYFLKAIGQDLNIKGEYYCSLVYNLMVSDNLNIGIYEIEYFMQWGTPEDLEEYNYWSNIFRRMMLGSSLNKSLIGTTVISMAGKGSRFSEEGYDLPKPLININSLPMFIQATKSLPVSSDYIFITTEQISNNIVFKNTLNNYYPNSTLVSLQDTPKGQALSVLEGIKHIKDSRPITISSCDHSVIFNSSKFNEIISNTNYDLIVWMKKGHFAAKRNPHMYGWISHEGIKVKKVSVKKPLLDPSIDPIVIGTFTFRDKNVYENCANSLIKRNCLVNNEFYVDSLINDAIKLNYNCIIFEVESFICWGTPNELKTFKYWNDCFSKWKSHIYSSLNS